MTRIDPGGKGRRIKLLHTGAARPSFAQQHTRGAWAAVTVIAVVHKIIPMGRAPSRRRLSWQLALRVCSLFTVVAVILFCSSQEQPLRPLRVTDAKPPVGPNATLSATVKASTSVEASAPPTLPPPPPPVPATEAFSASNPHRDCWNTTKASEPFRSSSLRRQMCARATCLLQQQSPRGECVCMWEQFRNLCIASTKAWNALPLWREGRLRCRHGINGKEHRHSSFKPWSLEFDNLLLRGCAADMLKVHPPPSGTSSLPGSALAASLARCRDGQPCGEARMRQLRFRLSRRKVTAPVRLVAVGASVTAQFGHVCFREPSACDIPATLEGAKLDDRLAMAARSVRQYEHGVDAADYMMQLLRVIRKRFPAPLSARVISYGGMGPRIAASCPSDFFTADVSCDNNGSFAEWADLVIIDFAIFGGNWAFPADADNIEWLVRALWRSRAAVILLNMANWCAGGPKPWRYHGHLECQRLAFDADVARDHVRNMTLPDPFHAQLGRIAARYSHVSVSLLHALAPLVARGELLLHDFTHDGKHPITFPRGTRRGSVYVRCGPSFSCLLSLSCCPHNLLKYRLPQFRPASLLAHAI